MKKYSGQYSYIWNMIQQTTIVYFSHNKQLIRESTLILTKKHCRIETVMAVFINRRSPALYSAHSLGYNSSIVSYMKYLSESWSYKI